jgi:hypothetical protein
MESLILDMLDWIAADRRSYADVMAAWRTSCPRLTVWEDAWDRGLVKRDLLESGETLVSLTPKGKAWLEDHRSGRRRIEGGQPAAHRAT